MVWAPGTDYKESGEKWLGGIAVNVLLTGTATLSATADSGKTLDAALSGSGTPSATVGNPQITADLTGTETLEVDLSQIIRVDLDTTGTLDAAVSPSIEAQASGTGTLEASFEGLVGIDADLAATGTLAATAEQGQIVTVSTGGESTLGATVAITPTITAGLASGGWLYATLIPPPSTNASLEGAGVLYAELFYEIPPPDLDEMPLGKLADFSVSTSAVPVNPAEGGGSTATVSGTFIAGPDPERVLGTDVTVRNGCIGTYTGEAVQVGTDAASERVNVTLDTILGRLNAELRLFPFIDSAPSTVTAMRAIDYWTQASGLFYEAVEGDVAFYQSCYGHPFAYGFDLGSTKFGELKGGYAAATHAGRSVLEYLPGVLSWVKAHESPTARVAVGVPKHRRLVFSTCFALLGTGRTSDCSMAFEDDWEITLRGTSGGTITALLNQQPLATVTVAAGSSVRATLSMEPLGSGMWTVKLTAGNQTDPLKAAFTGMPDSLLLEAASYYSSGGSGASMLRWGTYLSVIDRHPGEPAVQKSFAGSRKPMGFVSGFEGRVWDRLGEFCAINELDVSVRDQTLTVGPRNRLLSHPGVFGGLSRSAERREKYKQVALLDRRSEANDAGTALFYKADSVYQVAAREVFETTLQTDHSILSLNQPVPVWGIDPFPYTGGTGQFVVTGADGYIVAPQWWIDHGGKVEVELTENEGEILLRITAPFEDSVRAPYRISEGAADRPALYITGSGIMNRPLERHIATGARNAREGFASVFDSPFLSGLEQVYGAAMAMATEYSASAAEISFELDNQWDTPTALGQYPAGTLFTDGKRIVRVADANQTRSRVSGTGVPHTTVGLENASYPVGATLADEAARHGDRTIRETNIYPLKGV